jgi:UDP-GlcNAc:undecaprenyl-phosphate GlcNAc-1-phosphate transferase
MLMCLLGYVGAGVDMSFTTLLAAGMAASLLGFIYFNFPPAKIYMGDGGAYMLGFLIGLLALVNSHKGTVAAALLAPLFALALPIVDVTLAILRRGLKGLPIFRPDKNHIHHLLLKFGFSRRRSVLLLYSFSVAALLLAFGVFWSQGRLLPLMFGCLFFILAFTARSLGLLQDVFSLRTRLTNSLALRMETRYALTLSQWLELESERRVSLEELWDDFQFVVRKLGFSSVTLRLKSETRAWRTSLLEGDTARLQRMEYGVNGCGQLTFEADEQVMPSKLFELLCELAAETWHKAASRWHRLNEVPMEFGVTASPDTSLFQRNQTRPYDPGTAALWLQRRGLKTQSS